MEKPNDLDTLVEILPHTNRKLSEVRRNDKHLDQYVLEDLKNFKHF